eukprot:CAMPEP_0201739164 /NCGR_PEP_ID=MMETSP0593-20130828/45628_1 /ASSEMBLY_ACC=CAM_ASM_000672 /TAXON_ID=267983 /ORGANISM="Skeletonema japonicum, Strain CCMP2506" /LENGTH=1246 /DNA_ID=CAMNT_0048233417 /DNA_START=29 /DNA_END=3770 /DNA_ORIENTATION=-
MSSSSQPSPTNGTASSSTSSERKDATKKAHKVLTYSRNRPSAKTGSSSSDTLRKNDKAAQTYHTLRSMLSLVFAACILMGCVLGGNYIGKTYPYLFVGEGKMQMISDLIDTYLFDNISLPLASAYGDLSSSSSSDDDDDDDSSDDEKTAGDIPNPYHCIVHNPNGSCRTWSNVQHFYNPQGKLETKWSTCDTEYTEDNEDGEEVHSENSLYQKVFFEENVIAEDKCLWLDHTMQQCASYRPHYHEPFVHLSAAYTDVKRVVFVGGGDSMLLHEVLKYPSLEMVLGLELDQVVTRNSFEHFKTQPHFDDERVQWWFGDGAKSLTMLPREYFGTFDLVLLDLSETVMSMTVTDGLDVFGAMKLLLSPTGIMVKNDFGYFDKMSRVFDTCIQLDIQNVFYIDERVQWWFGDGAKSLTLLPREYFGTFDLVLLDLSETVMSMTVTEGLDVFGAMKLLLSPTGIMVKNDFGYFESLSRVFDTCIQLDIRDVFYICDYELVLCGTDQVDFLNPKFDHLKGVEGSTFNVDTLVYKPQEEGRDDHWGPLTDYSKYWGEPSDCLPPGTTKEVDDESIAYAGVLMIVEAENVSNMKAISELEGPLKQLGYDFITSSSQPSEKSGGTKHVIVMKEGYLLMESWPDANYCKIDIHLWGRFEKQDNIRSKVLDMLGSKEGDWQSYRIVTGGVRGCHTRADDLKSTGPDLSRIGVCDEVREGSSKSVVLDASSDDEAVLGPIIDAGLDEIIPTIVGAADNMDAVVICGPKGSPCRAKTNLQKKGYKSLTTLYTCPEKEDEMDKGQANQMWRDQMNAGGEFFPDEFVLCGRKAGAALRDITRMSSYPEVVVVDALAPSEHVSNVHEYFVKTWVNNVDEHFVFFVPILDATDEQRTSFLKSRLNSQDTDPEFYSEIYAGDGEKTMSFGLIHAGIFPEVVVVDALAPSEHVSSVHEHFVALWMKHVHESFVFFVPILDATDEQRTSFLDSLNNARMTAPEFYSEIYVGDGEKTMSFGLIHAGTSASLLLLKESLSKLDQNEHVKFSDLRRVSIRGAARHQPDFNPVTFKQEDYDLQPGLEQFYGQRAIGFQTVFQLVLKDAEEDLTALSISTAANAATKSMSKGKGIVDESFHEMGEGALYVALTSNAQVVVTWDGAGSINVNIFTYDETVNHRSLFVSRFKASLPSMDLALKDEFPRGYGKVINKSDRVNRGESPNCYDHYKLCQNLSNMGRCEDNAKDWMRINCQFSCGLCEKKDGSRDEL